MAFHPKEIELISRLDGKRVLELGCGVGYTIDELVKMFDRVIGVEPEWQTMVVNEAKSNYNLSERFIPVCARGDGLPFENESFDGVISHWALHHYRYPLTVLTEAYRILRHNGWLYIADGVEYSDNGISPRQVTHILFHKAIIYADRKLGKDHFPLRSIKNILDIVKSAGYVINDSEIVCEELETDDTFSQSYIERIETMIKLANEKSIAGEVIENLKAVIERIKRIGISPAPFAMILATKNYRR